MRRHPAALGLVLLFFAAPRSEARLGVEGAVVQTALELQVKVVVTNRGERAVPSVTIVGEILGQRQQAETGDAIPAGGRSSVLLAFQATGARPGTHALVLLIEHAIEGAPDAAGNPPLASERAWLPLALGQASEPAVRLEPKPIPLSVTGSLAVGLESLDGAAHRVRLRAFAPRGLRAESPGVDIAVPAQGTVTAELPLVRSGAPRGSEHRVLVVAETIEGLARTSVSEAVVHIAPDPSLFPRLRLAVLVLAGLLLGTAIGVEVWIRIRRQG